ncbi:hypothetical protein Q9966_003341 [Columba livia]|nr:hypothetical protein Q9966_003341 [Columba livia]
MRKWKLDPWPYLMRKELHLFPVLTVELKMFCHDRVYLLITHTDNQGTETTALCKIETQFNTKIEVGEDAKKKGPSCECETAK